MPSISLFETKINSAHFFEKCNFSKTNRGKSILHLNYIYNMGMNKNMIRDLFIAHNNEMLLTT